MNKNLLAVLIATLGIVLVWVLFFWNPATDGKPAEHQTMALSAKPVGGDFTVEIQNKDLALQDLRGKVVLLYFGYTQCPDICPTSLSLLSQALSEMTEDELAGVQSIFISVDPDRDNTARLDEYTRYFHENIIGATAEKEDIDRITAQYGASYRIVDSNSAMGYIVDHSSFTYVIDQQGKLRQSLAHGTEPAKILEAVRGLLAEKPASS